MARYILVKDLGESGWGGVDGVEVFFTDIAAIRSAVVGMIEADASGAYVVAKVVRRVRGVVTIDEQVED